MKHRQKYDTAKLSAHLYQLDPDVDWSDWSRAMMVIYNETGGSEEGFALVDAWSSGGTRYQGTKDVRRQWKSFKPNHKKLVLLGTLIRMVRMKKRAA